MGRSAVGRSAVGRSAVGRSAVGRWGSRQVGSWAVGRWAEDSRGWECDWPRAESRQLKAFLREQSENVYENKG